MTGARANETVPGRPANGADVSTRQLEGGEARAGSERPGSEASVRGERELLVDAARVLRDLGQRMTAEAVETVARSEAGNSVQGEAVPTHVRQ
jgi:hypothetical protein